MSLRILHVSNFSRTRCGIRNFGDQTSIALRLAGADVTDWDCEYDTIYEKLQRNVPAYLPGDAASYDVIHYNWHPITSNTYNAEVFPAGPLLSVYLNDIPPFSGCPFHDRADVRFAAEPSPGCVELPYPIADWVTDLPRPATTFTVGVAGVRGDGQVHVRQVCQDRDWTVLEPDRSGWLSFDDAVRHQARATVNVLWYHEERGKSGGASQAVASRRPVLLNESLMFTHLRAYGDELYFRQSLKEGLDELHQRWVEGLLRYPGRVIAERGWVSWGAPLMLQTWEEALNVRR